MEGCQGYVSGKGLLGWWLMWVWVELPCWECVPGQRRAGKP